MMKNPKFYLSLFALTVVIAVAWAVFPVAADSSGSALAEYQIEKMTCGSCVGKIEKALSDLDGIASVEVNLTSNRGRIIFDPERIDSKSIAQMITAAGYPARLRLELDSQEYMAMQQEQAQLGQKYLAKIGDRLLARSEFEQLVRQSSANAGVAQPGDQLWQAVWKDLLQRELLLSAAEQNQIVIQDVEVDARLDELRQQHQGLDQIVVERFGGMDSFRQRLREEMIINRNLEDHVYAGVTAAEERQSRLQSWYGELQKNTEVIIFDQKLKTVSQGGGGCACCNS